MRTDTIALPLIPQMEGSSTASSYRYTSVLVCGTRAASVVAGPDFTVRSCHRHWLTCGLGGSIRGTQSRLTVSARQEGFQGKVRPYLRPSARIRLPDRVVVLWLLCSEEMPIRPGGFEPLPSIHSSTLLPCCETSCIVFRSHLQHYHFPSSI